MQSSEYPHENIAQYYTTVVDTLYEIGRAYYFSGQVKKAQRLLSTSLQLLEVGEVSQERHFKLLLLYGQVLLADHLLSHGGGNVDLLFSTMLKARQVAESSQTQQGIADALSLLGLVHYFMAVVSGAVVDTPQSGKYDEALAYQQQALELREALHDTQGISESLFQIGVIHERWQQYGQSEDYYTRAIEIADQYGHLFEKVEPTRHFAVHALMRGDLDEALSLALRALELREAVRFVPYQPLDHLLLREIYQAKQSMAKAQLHA